jgi:homoserine O-acetyltransferase
MSDVALVYVPYGALERPSLALSVLKAALQRAQIDCSLRYTTFDFAERIGSITYADMVWVRAEMIGEWTFAGAAFAGFEPDHDEYMRRILATYAPADEAQARRITDKLWRIRHQAEAFVERTAATILAEAPRIVACSSTFNQHCSALALTRRIKELDPSVVTVIGGGNCEGEMGLTTLRAFEWVDLVVSGEAEDTFPALCRQVFEHGGPPPGDDLPFGVFGPVDRAGADADGARKRRVTRAIVGDLNRCPTPDFDDYFAALEGYAGRRWVTPGLLIETSRGCWWGEVNHCTFCGLNGSGMHYRSKAPERAIAEFRELASRYDVPRFLVVDNILDRGYFSDVLPALAGDPRRLTLFYEIKANVTYDQLRILRDAGATWLQPGIESLHADALKLMRKGTQPWINLQLLKWARELGLSIGWNILCGFPGELDEWYAEMAELVPLVEHFEPCTELRPIRFDRFSPYQADPEQFGLRLRPAWPYAYIYPLDEAALRGLVYAFEDADRPPQFTNPLRLAGDNPMPSLGGPGRDLLQARIRGWQRAFLSSMPPVLSMVEHDDHTKIIDTRTIAPALRVTLTGLEHRVHRACFAAAAPRALRTALAQDGGDPVDEDQLLEALDALRDRKLVARLGNRHLALAIRGSVPRLPHSHREGYPGGWVYRPKAGRPPTARRAPAATRRRPAVGAGADVLANPTLRHRRHTLAISEPLMLSGGAALERYELGFETYGTLSPARDNAVLVCHSLTKDAHAAGRRDDGRAGWWDRAIGPGKMLDTERRFVISIDALGSGASSGPASVDPATGRPYATTFPVVTVSDMVDAARPLLDHLGIEQLEAVIGGCFGGQHAITWAIRHPHVVRNVVVVSATAATSAHTIAIFSAMRRLIRSDPAFAGGDYYGGPFPRAGLGNALVAAVPLWMSREAVQERFGRRRAGGREYDFALDGEFDVERYLDRVATRRHAHIDPNALMYLMRAVEYFDLEHEFGSLSAALAPVAARALLVSYRRDWRYPPEEVGALHEALVAAGCDSRHEILDSPYGHGAFLYDEGGLARVLREQLDAATALT